MSNEQYEFKESFKSELIFAFIIFIPLTFTISAVF